MEAEYSAGPCDFCLKYCSVAKKSRYKLGGVCEEKIPALKKNVDASQLESGTMTIYD